MNNRKLLIPMAAALLALAGCGPSGSSDSSATDGASSSPDSSLDSSEESSSSSEETITDSPEESDSEQTSSSEVTDSEESSSSDVTDSEEPVGPEKTIDQAILDEWAEATIDFTGTLTDTYYPSLTDIVGFIGKNTYSMLETGAIWFISIRSSTARKSPITQPITRLGSITRSRPNIMATTTSPTISTIWSITHSPF